MIILTIMPENNGIININIDEYMKTDPDDMDYDEAIKEDIKHIPKI